jgi:hypothetical protein
MAGISRSVCDPTMDPPSIKHQRWAKCRFQGTNKVLSYFRSVRWGEACLARFGPCFACQRSGLKSSQSSASARIRQIANQCSPGGHTSELVFDGSLVPTAMTKYSAAVMSWQLPVSWSFLRGVRFISRSIVLTRLTTIRSTVVPCCVEGQGFATPDPQ